MKINKALIKVVLTGTMIVISPMLFFMLLGQELNRRLNNEIIKENIKNEKIIAVVIKKEVLIKNNLATYDKDTGEFILMIGE